uniref:Uncharacterized protein n=1 Tax=Pristionchus pacificus TaxID=54126 RepID=A0A2A6CU79_PRIPA|eukprot:PDM81709.1 hypothetical protein PRIPAC_30690 [Pristionchus pacificus]
MSSVIVVPPQDAIALARSYCSSATGRLYMAATGKALSSHNQSAIAKRCDDDYTKMDFLRFDENTYNANSAEHILELETPEVSDDITDLVIETNFQEGESGNVASIACL